MLKQYDVTQLENSWKFDRRWTGIERPYSGYDVCKLRGTIVVEQTLARMGAERLWQLMQKEDSPAGDDKRNGYDRPLYPVYYAE